MPRKLHQMPSGPPDPLPGVQPLVNDPAIMHRIGLNMTRAETNSFVQSLDRLYFDSLADSELPAPEGMWISDSPEITAAIENHIKNRRMADIRTKRRPIHQINPSDWKGIIPRGKSAILIDSSTNAIFAVVIRNTVGDTGLVKWMDGVAQQHTDIARNIRVRLSLPYTSSLHHFITSSTSPPSPFLRTRTPLTLPPLHRKTIWAPWPYTPTPPVSSATPTSAGHATSSPHASRKPSCASIYTTWCPRIASSGTLPPENCPRTSSRICATRWPICRARTGT